MIKITPRQRELIRYAVALDSRESVRNHYEAVLDSPDDLAWAELVANGLALVLREPDASRPMTRVYSATFDGVKAAR